MKKIILLLIGNTFEHFDRALFSILMPFIAAQFFGPISIYKSLALAFLPFDALFRPLGAYFLSKRGDIYGRKRVYLFSIFGTACITFCLAGMPSYARIGILSPILLLLFKAALSFFSAVESTGAFLLLLENPKQDREKISSLYQISTMLGVLLATVSVLVLNWFEYIQAYWRWLYLLGTIGCLVVLGYHKDIEESLFTAPNKPKQRARFFLASFLSLCFVNGFSYGNYFILMTVMHIFLQNFMNISTNNTLQMQVSLIVLDIILLWILHPFLKRKNPGTILLFCLAATLILAFPLFHLLHQPSYGVVFMTRLVFLVLGVVYAIALPLWSIRLFPKDQRFRAHGLAKSIGGQWLGASAISLCLLLYERFQSPYVFASYLCILAFIALIGVALASYVQSRTLLMNEME